MRCFVLTLSLIAGAVLAGCTTPSIPIPPPSPEKMAFEVDVETETILFSYDPEPSYSLAIVYLFNRDVGEGLITTAREDGSVGPTDPIPAKAGDDLVVTFELEQQLAATCITVQPGKGSSAFRCSL